jgi:uncharacterized protein Usg
MQVGAGIGNLFKKVPRAPCSKIEKMIAKLSSKHSAILYGLERLLDECKAYNPKDYDAENKLKELNRVVEKWEHDLAGNLDSYDDARRALNIDEFLYTLGNEYASMGKELTNFLTNIKRELAKPYLPITPALHTDLDSKLKFLEWNQFEAANKHKKIIKMHTLPNDEIAQYKKELESERKVFIKFANDHMNKINQIIARVASIGGIPGFARTMHVEYGGGAKRRTRRARNTRRRQNNRR